MTKKKTKLFQTFWFQIKKQKTRTDTVAARKGTDVFVDRKLLISGKPLSSLAPKIIGNI